MCGYVAAGQVIPQPEIYDQLGKLPFTAKFRYDGQRAQIHAIRQANNGLSVKIFSCHLEDITSKVKFHIYMINH